MNHPTSRRTFLITTLSATAAAMAWEPLISVCKGTTNSKLRRLNLAGDWQVSQAGKNEWIASTVPGSIYTDLLLASKIPDPFYRDNEKAVKWVGESDWIFKRIFNVPEEILKNDHVRLRCEGLDTVATIEVNGQQIGRADNMFRLWEFDVKPVLRPGENVIVITFESAVAYIKAKETDQPPAKWIKGSPWIRKEPCSFGWDWGPNLPGCGIWKNITLETFDEARITDVLVRQDLSRKNRATLEIEFNVETIGSGVKFFQAVITVVDQAKIISSKTIAVSNGQGRGQLEIRHPRLWWPAGMGEQPLYEVHVELQNTGGIALDSSITRVGLRELKVILPQNEIPIHFQVNGVPFFSKGANWIPCDSFASRVTPEILRRYVADAVAVNINTLRFWGGGYYEDDALFNACDEMGICVWLDFKFACSAYPAFDEEFMNNVRFEARDNLRRLRHHPCIAVWCGNNEVSMMSKSNSDEWRDNTMSRSDYNRLFKQLLPQQVAELAPQANYVSGSPDCGDTHYWEVWHGGKTFDAFRSITGFMSEFGYQSFPEPKTIRAFTNEADRASIETPVMKWHQRSGNGQKDGNQEMLEMMLHYFNPPRDFEATLWLSQILQANGIKTGAEYWRQTMPKSTGCVYWQYNDIWPGMSWSSVDYFGRWKALHYLARKFYAPLLVSGLENPKEGTIELFVTSDRLEPQAGKLVWRVTDLAGKTLSENSFSVHMPARTSKKVKTLNLHEHIEKLGPNGLLTWLKLEVDEKTVSENLVLLALPKELPLLDPKLAWSTEPSGDGFLVTITSAAPALWTWLELKNVDARFSDNFTHVAPGLPRSIQVQPAVRLNREAFSKLLRVRSLIDLA